MTQRRPVPWRPALRPRGWTSLAKQRTDLARERNTLAEERTGLATTRTTLSTQRTDLALGRRYLALIRTGLAFLVLGVSLFRWFGPSWWSLFDGVLAFGSLAAIVSGVRGYRRVSRRLRPLLSAGE